MTGRAEPVDEDAEMRPAGRAGLRPWVTNVERPFWIRIRPSSVTGRRTPGRH